MEDKGFQIVTVFAIFVVVFSTPINGSPRRVQTCGMPFRNGRIVGGRNAQKGEFPWMVSFKSKHGHFCGGTVISDNFILSAAHCFHMNEYLEYTNDGSIKLTSLNATLSEYSLKNTQEAEESVGSLKAIHLHPEYDPGSKQNDIALIEIASSEQGSIHPVCLPESGDDHLWKKGAKATVIGWGKLHHNQDYYDWVKNMDALQKVDVKVWDKKTCTETYKGFPRFPSRSFLCAGEKEKESCTGDSGGPLLRKNGHGKWTLIGVVANGNKCGARGRPGIYTLVSDFLPWIDSFTTS